jgi:uncharacterized protein YciW
MQSEPHTHIFLLLSFAAILAGALIFRRIDKIAISTFTHLAPASVGLIVYALYHHTRADASNYSCLRDALPSAEARGRKRGIDSWKTFSLISFSTAINEIDLSKWKNEHYSIINGRYSKRHSAHIYSPNSSFGFAKRMKGDRIKSWHGRSTKFVDIQESTMDKQTRPNTLSRNSYLSLDSPESEVFDREHIQSSYASYADEEIGDDDDIEQNIIDMSVDFDADTDPMHSESVAEDIDIPRQGPGGNANDKVYRLVKSWYHNLGLSKDGVEEQNFIKPFKLRKQD